MSRIKFFNLSISILFVIFVFQLVKLQVFEWGPYHRQADENAAQTTPIPAPRGIVCDRFNKVLLKNRPIFSVYIIPPFLPKERREEVFTRLASILNKPKEEIFKIYRKNKKSWSEGILVEGEVSSSMASNIEEQKDLLPGVEVILSPVRAYPYGSQASHVLGYIGEIEPKELGELRPQGYRMGDLVGKDGVEKQYDKYLRGVAGGKKIIVDPLGRSDKVLESVDPIPGAEMVLTIDIDLQLAAERALSNQEGAVVVLDPKTGEILALVSHPNFNPQKPFEDMNKPSHPFMDRALSAYPPGSTFKVVTLSAALQSNLTSKNENFVCKGYYKIGKRIAECWKASGHGILSPIEGLVWSCDVVFYELGRRLGPDLIHKFANLYGLGEKTGIDLPQERRGFIPTAEWKKERFNENWYEGDSINIGIGQGFIQVTPLQLALMYGEIATGKRMVPYVVKEIIGKEKKPLYLNGPQKISDVPISIENLALIRTALRDVVGRGTGRAADVVGLPAAGKTGTAQTPGLPHAWFACYAPFDNPKIVVVAFVAHGEHGDRASAYVARDILTWYRDNRLPKVEDASEL